MCIEAKQTTINRLRQAAASEPEELKRLEDEVRQSLEKHREEGLYEVTESCTKKWKQIEELKQLKESSTLDEDKEHPNAQVEFVGQCRLPDVKVGAKLGVVSTAT